MEKLLEGLEVVGAGITCVFVVLLVLMTVVMLLGRLFGRRPAAKVGSGGAPAPTSSAGPSQTHTQAP